MRNATKRYLELS